MRGIDAVLQVLSGGIYDIKIGFDGDIETKDSFDTYILVALFTDRRAGASEIVVSNYRRGWIGNEYTPGFEMGSKLWIYLEMPRLTKTVQNKIQTEAINALQSLVSEGLAQAIRGAELEFISDGVSLVVDIQRTPSQVEKRYFDLWQNTGV